MRPLTFLALASLLTTAGAAARSPAPPPAPPAHEDWSPAQLKQAGIDAAKIRCNRENRWLATLRPDAKEGAAELMTLLAPSLKPITEPQRAELQKKVLGVLFWRMVRSVLIEGNNNNLGAVTLKGRTYVDKAGKRRPVVLFRSALTPFPEAPGSCFQSLLDAGGVRHVVNLFDGEIPAADLVAGETRAAAQAGASYTTASDDAGGYGTWRDTLRSHYDDPEKRQKATMSVARLIREQILAPKGAPPAGNVHIHCGGGMHRSGMIAGIVERCINGEPMANVETHYRYHVGYRDAEHPGGLEEGNLRFIREFDCKLLEEPK